MNIAKLPNELLYKIIEEASFDLNWQKSMYELFKLKKPKKYFHTVYNKVVDELRLLKINSCYFSVRRARIIFTQASTKRI